MLDCPKCGNSLDPQGFRMRDGKFDGQAECTSCDTYFNIEGTIKEC